MIAVLFWLQLFGKAFGDSYDVTTLYRLDDNLLISGQTDFDDANATQVTLKGATEIHSRTNALGLPFLLPGRQIIDPSVGADFAVCDSIKCPWTLTNWNKTKYPYDIPQPPLISNDNDYFDQETDGGDITSYREFNENVEIKFQPFGSSGSAAVYLLDGEADITTSSMYGIRVSPQMRAIVIRCTGDGWDNYYRIAERYPSRMCTEIYSTTFEASQWEVNNGPYIFKITTTLNIFTFTVTKEERTLAFMEWDDGRYINLEYVACATLDFGGRFYSLEDVYALDGPTGRMSSPVFAPGGSRLCVSLTSYVALEAELQLSAQGAGLELSVATEVARPELAERAWRTERFVVDLPAELQKQHLSLTLVASNPFEGHVLIQRLAGCNAEAPEDIAIVSHEIPQKIFSESGFDVAVFKTDSKRKSVEHRDADCLHGGVRDEEDGFCVCPVGFIGKKCEEGCGPNSFGNDCGGTCSPTTNECRNIIMCRPKVKCDCAPGFKGHICDTLCSEGEYGAGCKQTCGHCKNSHCDIYTGVCHDGCIYGYARPFCKEELRRLKSPPTLDTIGFYDASVNIDLSDDNLLGEGEPIFYQLQYKESSGDEWLEHKLQEFPANTSQPISKSIKHLVPGTSYDVRVLIICAGDEHTVEDTLPKTSFVAMCLIPLEVEYNISLHSVTEREFFIKWDYIAKDNTTCPAIKYEVHQFMNWQWALYRETPSSYMTITDALPGSRRKIRVRAVTVNGPARFSPVLDVKLRDGVPQRVVHLHAEETLPRVTQNSEYVEEGISLTWQPPRQTSGVIRHYKVSYRCTGYVSCQRYNCDQAEELQVQETSAVLRGLYPHAHYIVSVAAVSGSQGPWATLALTTHSAAPEVAPTASQAAVASATNSSLEVRWEQPRDCRGLRGVMHGYKYWLVPAGGATEVARGVTEETSLVFTGLQPHTAYQVRVCVLTSAGYNPRHMLVFNATTKSTVPGPVRGLVVYKRSRKLLGVRWSAPLDVSGTLSSFRLSFMRTGDSEETSLMLELEPCSAWSADFCHTLLHLVPRSQYRITVWARNAEVDDDGDKSTVLATTVEDGAPDAPESLQILNHSNASLTVQWKLPRLFRGIIRSYVLNIEQTDAFDSSDCCQYFPLLEVPVRSELPWYSHTFANLSSASKYTVSVSWKTVALGPSATLMVATRPAAPEMDETVYFENNKFYVEGMTTEDNLLRGYLVLVRPENSSQSFPVAKFHSADLAEVVRRNINGPFHIAAELIPEELEKGSAVIELGRNEKKDGVFCRVENLTLPAGRYTGILVKIREYSSVHTISWFGTDSFTIE
ncbi:uncharacterized protein LOC134535791 isoform X2 [Bacillus rossius redtenbacheri]